MFGGQIITIALNSIHVWPLPMSASHFMDFKMQPNFEQQKERWENISEKRGNTNNTTIENHKQLNKNEPFSILDG